jgi:hypothetical protein
MKNHFKLIIVSSLLLILISCGQDDGTGNRQPPVAGLSGTYVPQQTDAGTVRVTIAVQSDSDGNISGDVMVAGAVGCFSQGTFSSFNSTSFFDSQSRNGAIEASNGSSKALLYFVVSEDFASLEIQGGKSKLMDANGKICVVLENLTLRREFDRPIRE